MISPKEVSCTGCGALPSHPCTVPGGFGPRVTVLWYHQCRYNAAAEKNEQEKNQSVVIMSMSWVQKLSELRDAGWTVTVHNDYRISGQSMTFWLFDHVDGRQMKGEGKTDAEAIEICWQRHKSWKVIPDAQTIDPFIVKRIWAVKEAFRFYIDASDNELRERNISRESVLCLAREMDRELPAPWKDDGTGIWEKETFHISSCQTSVPWPQNGIRRNLEPFDTTKYDYEVTENPRKQESIPPSGEGWTEIDWDRHALTESVLWRRSKVPGEGTIEL